MYLHKIFLQNLIKICFHFVRYSAVLWISHYSHMHMLYLLPLHIICANTTMTNFMFALRIASQWYFPLPLTKLKSSRCIYLLTQTWICIMKLRRKYIWRSRCIVTSNSKSHYKNASELPMGLNECTATQNP